MDLDVVQVVEIKLVLVRGIAIDFDFSVTIGIDLF